MKVHHTIIITLLLFLPGFNTPSLYGYDPAVNPSTIFIEIVSPDPTSVYVEGDDIQFAVNITSSNPSEISQIDKVVFFNGTTPLGEDTDLSNGASITFQNIPPGTLLLRAQALGASGGVLVEDEVTIIVRALPRASLVTPTQGREYIEGDAVNVEVEATDGDGNIVRVEIYEPNPRVLVETVTTSSGQNIFEYSWQGLTPGNYEVYAIAFDNDGASVTTDTIGFQVLDRPAVAITSPKAGDEFAEGDTITIVALVNDLEQAIDTIRFFYDGILLEERVNATDFVYEWQNVPPVGLTDLTVEVVDNTNLKSVSAALPIKIKAKPTLTYFVPFTTTDAAAAPVFDEGDSIRFIIYANDADGFLDYVEFYVSDTLLFTDSTGVFQGDKFVYEHTWVSNRAGVLPFYATAYDNDTLSRTTQLFLLNIRARPKVSFILPANNTEYGLGNDIPLEVSAVDQDNEILAVEFYVKDPNGIQDSLLSTDTDGTDGWESMWQAPPLGNHILYAIAVDETAIKRQSSDLNVTVFPRSHVDYFSFKTKQIPTGIKLDWQTRQLYRLASFEIERSLDGKTFTSLASSSQMVDVNTSTQLLSYSFTDPWTDISDSEKLYYRVKGVGQDNQFTYSRVDSILRGKEFTVDIFPIPISQSGAARIIIGGEADLLVFRDLTGRAVHTQAIPQDQKRIFFAGKTLEPGFYILSIKSIIGEGENQREFEVTRKILIQGDF